jgi:hypothetical protein
MNTLRKERAKQLIWISENESSADIAMRYQDFPFSFDELIDIKEKVTKECWKYLVGTLCKREKDNRCERESIRNICEQMGIALGYSIFTIKRAINYAIAIEKIQELLPNIATDILNGKMRFTAFDTIALAKMDFLEICAVVERLENENTSAKIIIVEQKILRKKTNRPGRPKRDIDEALRTSVKDTPLYNPNAQINALAYTIPSWVSMVERTMATSVFSETSLSARDRLMEEASKLTEAINNISRLLKEEK